MQAACVGPNVMALLTLSKKFGAYGSSEFRAYVKSTPRPHYKQGLSLLYSLGWEGLCHVLRPVCMGTETQ